MIGVPEGSCGGTGDEPARMTKLRDNNGRLTTVVACGSSAAGSMEEFHVTVELRHGCQLVSVGGHLDGDTAPWLERELDRIPRRPVIVDLSRVTTLTSAGVQALLRDRRFGRPALFCRPNSSVERVLEIVKR